MTRVFAVVVVLLVAAAAWWASRAPGAPPPREDAAPRQAQLVFEPSRREALAVEPAAQAEVREMPKDGVAPETAEKNRLALRALDEARHEDALVLLEECLAASPAQPVLRHNLAEALWRRAHARDLGAVAQLELSIADLSRAIELAPERAEIPPRRAEWQKRLEAQRGMWTDQSAHFVLSYDGERGDLLASYSQILALLEDAYGEYVLLFGIAPVEAEGRPVSVVLYRRQAFRDATSIGHWAGGLYDGVVRVPVEDLSKERASLSRVLRHELAHAFVARAGGGKAPGWLNEGLAMKLEDDAAAWRGRVKDAGQRLRAMPAVSAEELGGTLASIAGEDKIRAAYVLAVLLVDELVRVAGERAPYELLEAAAQGGFEARFERLAGASLADELVRLRGR